MRRDRLERGNGYLHSGFVLAGVVFGVHGMSGGKLLRVDGPGGGVRRVRSGPLLRLLGYGVLGMHGGLDGGRVKRGVVLKLRSRSLPAVGRRNGLC